MARAPAPPAVGAPDEQAPAAQPRRPQSGSRLIWAIAVVVALLAAAVLWRVGDGGPAPLSRADVDGAVRLGIGQAQQDERNAPPDAAAAYRTILPSLVTVTTGSGNGGALGTGVVINARGAVLTAYHVVEGAGEIQVRFADGTTAGARVGSSRRSKDIAVLAVDRLPQVVVPAVMGGGARIGDAVFPVGNPLGLRDSLSAGVVSALDRTVRTESRTLEGLIQFDAAVNPGNSGGPLLNRDGQVVGIVTGLANPSKQPYFVGIGFAVPIETAGGVAGGPRK